MNMATKQAVLQAHLGDWLRAKGNRVERGKLTRLLVEATKLHPKSVGRSMRSIQMRSVHKPKKKRGRPRYYDKAVDAAISELWASMECPCAEVMHPEIDTYIDSHIRASRWRYSDETTGKLRSISLGTLKDRISTLRVNTGTTRGYSSTTPSAVQLLVPIRKSHTWHTLPPGYGQTDTVAHCGDLLSGDIIYSLGIVDFSTYWAEYTTQWNKGQEATRASLELLTKRFPFSLRELHPDTGSEYINQHVYRWTQTVGITMTRSEPYKKNDNMCIEERNNTIPRRHLGYLRLDNQSLVPVAAEILRVACLIHNHFRPVRRMMHKERRGAKWHRTYEKVARTPYARVMSSPAITKQQKARLEEVHEALDPLRLQDELARLKEELTRQLEKLNKINSRVR